MVPIVVPRHVLCQGQKSPLSWAMVITLATKPSSGAWRRAHRVHYSPGGHGGGRRIVVERQTELMSWVAFLCSSRRLRCRGPPGVDDPRPISALSTGQAHHHRVQDDLVEDPHRIADR